MNEVIIKNVEFCNAELLAVQDKETGKIYAGINSILRELGFDEKQIEYRREKWTSDKTLLKGTRKFSGTLIGANTGKDVWCIDIKKLPLALAKIDITPKIENDMPWLSEKLEKYQDECADILADAFIDKTERMYMPKDFPTALRAYADECEKNMLLEQKNDILNKENDLLAQKNLEWADRAVVNAMVRAYGYGIGGDYRKAWRDFKKELLYRHGININARITNYLNRTEKRTKPKTLDVLDDSELSSALSTITAMCRENDIDISDIIQKKVG